MNLVRQIKQEIVQKGGTLTFRDYMEKVLYTPDLGYYSSGKNRVGIEGDFYTSVSNGPLFGQILAQLYEKIRATSFSEKKFTVVEWGGHRGQLKEDVLKECPHLNYINVEVGSECPKNIQGVIFSNELFDALPVHRVQVRDGKWRELGVELVHADDSQLEPIFREVCLPHLSPGVLERLSALPVLYMQGYTTEVCIDSEKILAQMATTLDAGYVVIVDYGLPFEEYYGPGFSQGHLQTYFKHQKTNNPYINVGNQDITAHVEWDSLLEAGKRLGLTLEFWGSQEKFLVRAGQSLINDLVERAAGAWSRERNALMQLIHPAHMGRSFKVLVFSKGVQTPKGFW